jgi:hypothetical protein
VHTLTRVIQRHTRRSLSTVNRPAPAAWVNDQEFEILESGIVADETVGWNRSPGHGTVPC